MLASIYLTLKIIGYFIVDHWRVTVPVILFIVLVAWILISRSCGHPPAKLNEAEIQTAITAVEQKNDAKLKEILVNSDVREKQIDANLANAKVETISATVDAKKKYENMNSSDLAAEIEKRK